jgi:hypothetical protein
MIDHSQQSLDEQHAAFLRTKFLAMPIAGTIAWIGIAGAVLPLRSAVWAIYLVTIAVRRTRAMGLLILLALWPSEAVAMQERPWEVEIYAGGTSGAGAVDGSGQLPPPGPVLVDSFQGRSIPTFPSWYFGAGAAYLSGGFGRPGLRIDPLDPVLTTASVTREGGGAFGVRLSRRVVERARIEVAVEHTRGRSVLTRETHDQLEATRASFVTFFNGLSSPFVVFSTTSSAAVRESGSVTAITGAVTIDLLSRRRILPFALVGGGLESRSGETPSISLNGRYVAQFGQVVSIGIAQTDTVEIHYALPKHRPMAIVGGGVRYAISPRFTARLDARASLTRDRVTITVDAAPATTSTVPTGAAALTIFSSSPPFTLDFATNPTGNNSLRGPALNDVVTFTGAGMQTRFSLTAGLGWKF